MRDDTRLNSESWALAQPNLEFNFRDIRVLNLASASVRRLVLYLSAKRKKNLNGSHLPAVTFDAKIA
mgnify:CR=1 FL=1